MSNKKLSIKCYDCGMTATIAYIDIGSVKQVKYIEQKLINWAINHCKHWTVMPTECPKCKVKLQIKLQ